jgi:hypothetical protein
MLYSTGPILLKTGFNQRVAPKVLMLSRLFIRKHFQKHFDKRLNDFRDIDTFYMLTTSSQKLKANNRSCNIAPIQKLNSLKLYKI